MQIAGPLVFSSFAFQVLFCVPPSVSYSHCCCRHHPFSSFVTWLCPLCLYISSLYLSFYCHCQQWMSLSAVSQDVVIVLCFCMCTGTFLKTFLFLTFSFHLIFLFLYIFCRDIFYIFRLIIYSYQWPVLMLIFIILLFRQSVTLTLKLIQSCLFR